MSNSTLRADRAGPANLRGEASTADTGSAVPLSRADVAHAVLDALERVGASYYRLNHAPAAQIGELADMVAGWLSRQGIPVT